MENFPSETTVEAVVSELSAKATKEKHEPGDDCEVCRFNKYLDDMAEKAKSYSEASFLDRMILRVMSHQAMFPLLTISGDLASIVWMARLCFLAGVKCGRLQMLDENQTLDK